MKDLDAEIAEMEKVYTDNLLEETVVEEPVEAKPEPVVVNNELEVATKRFNNYKASTDLTIRDLRDELAKTKSSYANLQQQFSDMVRKTNETQAKPHQIFSDDDIDILGEPAVNALNKGVNELLESKLKPLQEEVVRSREDSAKREALEAQRLARANYDKFISKLAIKVPDYEEVNVSPGFLDYMKQPDPDSGFSREFLFKKAEESHDVGRIASFFLDYKKEIGKKNPVLEESIMPEGVGAPSAPVAQAQEQIITRKFIDKFYSDLARGKYSTKKGREEAQKIEAMIDKAVYTGQVR